MHNAYNMYNSYSVTLGQTSQTRFDKHIPYVMYTPGHIDEIFGETMTQSSVNTIMEKKCSPINSSADHSTTYNLIVTNRNVL